MSRENVSRDLKAIAISKSLMLCTLLWFATFLPVLYKGSDILKNFPFSFVAILSFGVIYTYLLPLCYLVLSFQYRCPQCKTFWCYTRHSDKLLEVKYLKTEDDKIRSRQERVLERKKCAVCDYTKLTHKTNLIRESV